MNIQYNQYKKIESLLINFLPQLEFGAKDLNREKSEELIHYLIIIIDTLIKSENLYKKRNFILPEGKVFISNDIIDLMMNVNLYLYKFDTTIFTFTRTERQTFIFIIENIIDYFKRERYHNSEKEKKNLFVDYRFWIENFFKMFNQKITGSVYSNKKLNLKNFFYANDSINSELIYSNTSISFSISPFAINRDAKNYFLTYIREGQLIYLDITDQKQKENSVKNLKYLMKVYEFLISNFDFENAILLKGKLKNERHILLEKSEIIEKSSQLHKERLFMDSANALGEFPFENVDLPLVYLLQIKNLINTNRLIEVKKMLQKFVSIYPYYAEGYEIMGELYLKEEDFEMAFNSFENALKITQNKRVAEKLKKTRDIIEKNRDKAAKQKNENFFDITDSVYHNNDQLLRREKELRQMKEILISNSRRNIILIGESGVGKTALIRQLALDILNGNIPAQLKNLRLKEINFVSVLTGSKYRGQFEEKVLKLFNDFKTQSGILVLEDIHLMISTGAPRGTSMDLVNILKQFLRENTIQVIATTNYEEYKNSIEKDNALMSFFQKININEMSEGETLKVLKTLTEEVFSQEKIIISEDVLEQIIECSKRDIRDKKCPDAAVMIFERAVAKVKLKTQTDGLNKFKVETSDVAEVVSDILNLPENNLPIALKQRLLTLKEGMLKEVMGQDAAIEKLTSAIITSKLEFSTKNNRPDGVFLLIGPTGVGKTETGLALSRVLYGSEDHLVRIDMSEYMERFTYSRFVGAAPGYVGYMDSNQLTDRVRQNPYSIILLDEIEKADSQLLNIFLQVFDAGRLTDARGNIVNFSHTTIIMTSNIGTSLFSRTPLGYQSDLNTSHVSHAALIKALKKFFSPEFLNRIDEILIYNHLHEEEIKKIIDIQLESTRIRLQKQDKELVLNNDVIDFIIRNGYSREYGARHISRALRKYILEKIAYLSLEKEWEYARQVICSLDKEANKVNFQLESVDLETIDEEKFIEGVNIEP